jgi:hypothetical protein
MKPDSFYCAARVTEQVSIVTNNHLGESLKLKKSPKKKISSIKQDNAHKELERSTSGGLIITNAIMKLDVSKHQQELEYIEYWFFQKES